MARGVTHGMAHHIDESHVHVGYQGLGRLAAQQPGRGLGPRPHGPLHQLRSQRRQGGHLELQGFAKHLRTNPGRAGACLGGGGGGIANMPALAL
jgi:hypothetical protein